VLDDQPEMEDKREVVSDGMEEIRRLQRAVTPQRVLDVFFL
jgi:hypothetical protein